VTDLGAKYSLKGTTSPDHPLYLLGAFEKCPKFDPTLGDRESPQFPCDPAANLNHKIAILP